MRRRGDACSNDAMDPEPPVGPERVPSGTPPATPSGIPPPVERLLTWARVDLAPRHRQPPWLLVIAATVVSLAGSLGADELAVHVGTSLVPATAHFSHFRFSDYASLTVVGVLVACAGWPVVTRISSAPRRLFLCMAVAVTVVLWLPDAWLLVRGEQAAGVGVLMVMHLLIALVTYNALVRLATVRPAPLAGEAGAARPTALGEHAVRRLWNSMAALVALELVLGVATIVTVPFRRPDAILPSRATWLYAAHGAVGVALGVGALGLLVLSLLAGRMARIGAVLGAAGVCVGLVGGVFATFQVTRLLGMGVMMVGVVMAGIGYLIPSLEAMGQAEAARARAAREEAARANEARGGGSAGVSDESAHRAPSANGQPDREA